MDFHDHFNEERSSLKAKIQKKIKKMREKAEQAKVQEVIVEKVKQDVKEELPFENLEDVAQEEGMMVENVGGDVQVENGFKVEEGLPEFQEAPQPVQVDPFQQVPEDLPEEPKPN